MVWTNVDDGWDRSRENGAQESREEANNREYGMVVVERHGLRLTISSLSAVSLVV